MSNKLIIFAQLGSPKSPSVSDVRAYLKEFLSNPLVVDINRVLWKLILHLIILPFRSKKSAKRYLQIWNGSQFLLEERTISFVKKMNELGIESDYGNVIGDRSLISLIEKYSKRDLLIFPLFPQYCKSTTGLVKEQIGNKKLIDSYCNQDFYINSCVDKIRKNIDSVDSLIISFHSVPLVGNERYIAECLQTFQLIRAQLDRPNILVGFQSKFGKGRWMGPLLEELLEQEVLEGRSRIAVFCPGFLMDCLETTLEVGVELKQMAKNKWGIELQYIEALNSDLCEQLAKKSRSETGLEL